MARRIKDLPKFERPREKLWAKGPQALSDAELLAILIGSGTKRKSALELASDILRAGHGRLDQLGLEELAQIKGLGEAKVSRIAAALELARRHFQRGGLQIREPEDALPFFQEIRDKKQEHFAVLTLNGAGEVIQLRIVTVGLLDSTQVHPREVFADAISDRAAAIIIGHNHPSGQLQPSPEDIALTRRIVEAGKLLGIDVLDHLIVGKTGFFSFAKNALL
ncbi:DNA repair protein RadC [Candidatus Bipolaricaulota bacterium]|nr:DNA repair protein RadC [Candidatus Bipolaricaulota bacterium]